MCCEYTAVSEEFRLFWVAEGLEPVYLVPVEHLQQFAVYLNRKGLAPMPIQAKMSTSAFQAKALRVQDSTVDFRVRKMIEGCE